VIGLSVGLISICCSVAPAADDVEKKCDSARVFLTHGHGICVMGDPMAY
jgi:hypothetical protein